MSQTIEVQNSFGRFQIQFTDHSVSVYLDGSLIDARDVNSIASDGVHPNSYAIWERYKQVHDGNFVIRSGLGIYGCYEQDYDPSRPPESRYLQSDSEHANTCVELVRNLRIFYPDLLTPALYDRAERLLSAHDLGENVYGDRPDDGSQNREEKNRVELANFALAAFPLPTATREIALTDFVHFQDPLCTGYSEPDRRLAQVARCVDKADAVLSGIAYEKAGRRGDLRYKCNHYQITDQDRFFAEHTAGDTSLIATWTAHVAHDYHAYYGFAEVFDIIKAGVLDVRGAWFHWFEQFCQDYQIPATHLIPHNVAPPPCATLDSPH